MRGWEHVTAAQVLKQPGVQKPSKFHNVRVQVDGYTFDSKAEAQRYQVLKLREKAGDIHDLRVHPTYPLYCPVGATQVATVSTYEADFDFYEGDGLRRVVEDVKGARTALYRLKKRWLKLQEGIDIVEVRP